MQKTLLATAIVLYTTSALAADTAVLKVKGTLTNAACTAELGNGGIIDYGTIRLGELSATENNVIGQKQIPVAINCSSATKVGFTVIDNRSDSNAQLPTDGESTPGMTTSYYTYGIGRTAGGVKMGNYTMWLTDITANGDTVDGIGRNKDWIETQWSRSVTPRSDGYSIQGFATTGTTTPLAITSVTFNLVTNLVIRDTATLAITDDTPLDGQNTLTLVYL